ILQQSRCYGRRLANGIDGIGWRCPRTGQSARKKMISDRTQAVEISARIDVGARMSLLGRQITEFSLDLVAQHTLAEPTTRQCLGQDCVAQLEQVVDAAE